MPFPTVLTVTHSCASDRTCDRSARDRSCPPRSAGNLAPNATDSFQVNLYQGSCPSFLVGAASGYYK